MRTSRVLLSLATVGILMSAGAASAAAAGGMRVGVEDDWAFTSGAVNANHAIATAAQLRVGVIRVMVMWADVRGASAHGRRPPRRRHYNFHAYDGAVTRALQHHMQVQMVLTGPAPAWATGNRRKGTFAPKAGYYGEFARQAAQWFRGRVRQFSVWNEPTTSAGCLRSEVRLGSTAPSTGALSPNIKHVDARDQVLIGETSPYAERRRAIRSADVPSGRAL